MKFLIVGASGFIGGNILTHVKSLGLKRWVLRAAFATRG